MTGLGLAHQWNFNEANKDECRQSLLCLNKAGNIMLSYIL